MKLRLALALVLACAALALYATTCGARRPAGLEPPAPVTVPEPVPGELAAAELDPTRPAAATARSEAAPPDEIEEGAAEAELEDADRPLPEDVVEHGACALELHLVEDESGLATSGAMQLWRLRAPENDGWSAGDQLQAAVHVPVGGYTFKELPAGEYRVVHLGDAPGEPDPPAFWVNGALTVETVKVHSAAERTAYLELRDRYGLPIETIEVRRGTRSSSQREPEAPAWLTQRRPKRDGWGWGGGGAGGSYGSGSHRGWRRLTAGPRGFELGAVQESDRDTERHQVFRLRDENGAEVDLDVGPLPAAGGRLLATFVGEDDALANVRLPDGGDARGWAETHWVKLHPVVADDAHPGADFGDTRVEVVLYTGPATTRRVEWRLGDGFAPVLLELEDE